MKNELNLRKIKNKKGTFVCIQISLRYEKAYSIKWPKSQVKTDFRF